MFHQVAMATVPGGPGLDNNAESLLSGNIGMSLIKLSSTDVYNIFDLTHTYTHYIKLPVLCESNI